MYFFVNRSSFSRMTPRDQTGPWGSMESQPS